MMYPLYVLCTFLGTLQVATGVFDTSYYKILVDQTGGNFSYWDMKCRGELNFKSFQLVWYELSFRKFQKRIKDR